MMVRFGVPRKRRCIFLLTVLAVLGVGSLYLADLLFLHNTSNLLTLSAQEQTGIRDSIDKKQSASSNGFQCQKVSLKPISVNIWTEELWLDLFERTDQYPLGLEVWSHLLYNENESRTEPKLKVFVVPHSHVDPGWLKTVGDYSNETNNMLNNMLVYLPTHPNMTFTWMEIAFFETWWQGLTEDKKKLTKKLLKEGRFQITSGSWVMTDEASPFYWTTIDNIVEGHQFLKRELDYVPSVMWSNDPFGYGPTVPYLFNLAAVQRLVIQRVHSNVKAHFVQHKTMDFYYRQFFDSAGRFDSQVHILPNVHYDVPNTCGPHSEVCCQFDFKRITNWGCSGGYARPITKENLAEKAEALRNEYWLLSRGYRNNVVLVMLGDDFRYDAITEWSQQHDNYMKLMEYINGKEEWNMEVRFGTFNDFFNAFAERSEKTRDKMVTRHEKRWRQDKLNLPSVAGDFFPYRDVGSDYWTGYYTTRPFYKRQDRVVQAMIRAADIASSLVYFRGLKTTESRKWSDKLTQARRNLALFQHHDAITGTSKWPVVRDYGKKLQQALLNAADVASSAVGVLIGGIGGEMEWTMDMPSFNERPVDKVITLKPGEKTVLWIFNSLPYKRSELVRVQVSSADCLIVTDQYGKRLLSQRNPVFNLTGIESLTETELLFEAKLPPLAAVRFHMHHQETSDDDCAKFPEVLMGGKQSDRFPFPKQYTVDELSDEVVTLENDIVTTTHNSSTGLLQEIKVKNQGSMETRIGFWHYSGTYSGAYLFTPGNEATPWWMNTSTVVVLRGPLTQEVHSFGPCIHHKEYLRKSVRAPESSVQLYIENAVDIRKVDNIELVMRISSLDLISSNGSFLTDSMGLQLMPRRFIPTRPINMNYYPMASQLLLQDDEKRLTILSGQPHGATSHIPGGLEIMLERRLSADDSKGLGHDSLIRDNVPVNSVFRLIWERGDFTGSRALSVRSQRSLQHLLYPPVTFFQTASIRQQSLRPFVPLNDSFPCDTLLLNIRSLGPSSGRKKHLLLLHRVLTDCQSLEDNLCTGVSQQKMNDQISHLLTNPMAKGCSLSGVISNDSPVSSNVESRMDSYLASLAPLEPMEIRSVCVV